MGVFDKAIPVYTINNRGGVVIEQPEETPYIDDIFDPVFNKAVRDSLLERSNGSFGAAMARGYGELLRNTFVGHNDQWGMFGPGMGILSTFGRSMDKADDFILGAMTEAVRGLSGEKMQNPFTRIFRDDHDYTGKGLLAATTNLASPLVGGARVTEDDFKGLWNVPAVAVELATDPGIMGGAVSRRLLSKEARKATASDLLRNLGKADGKTRVGTAAKLLSDYDDFMSRVAIDVTAPGLRPLLRKIKHAAKQLFGANSANPYANTPLRDYRNAGSPPADNTPDGGFDNGPEDITEPLVYDVMPDVDDGKLGNAIDDASRSSKKKKRGRPSKILQSDVDPRMSIPEELERALVNGQRKMHGEPLDDVRMVADVDADYQDYLARVKNFDAVKSVESHIDVDAVERLIKKYAANSRPVDLRNLTVTELQDIVDTVYDNLRKTRPEIVRPDFPPLPVVYRPVGDELFKLYDINNPPQKPAKFVNDMEDLTYGELLDDEGKFIGLPTDYFDGEVADYDEDWIKDWVTPYEKLSKFIESLETGEGFQYSSELTSVQNEFWRVLQERRQPIISVRNDLAKHPETTLASAEGITRAIKVSQDEIRARGLVPPNKRELTERIAGDPRLSALVDDYTIRLYDRVVNPKVYPKGVYSKSYVDAATDFVTHVDEIGAKLADAQEPILESSLQKRVGKDDEVVDVFSNIAERTATGGIAVDPFVIENLEDLLEGSVESFYDSGVVDETLYTYCQKWLSENAKLEILNSISSEVPTQLSANTLRELVNAIEHANDMFASWRTFGQMQELADYIRPFLLDANSPADDAVNALLRQSVIPAENQAAFLDELMSLSKDNPNFRTRFQFTLRKNAPYSSYNAKAKRAAEGLQSLIKNHKPGEYWNNTVFEIEGVKYTLGKPSKGVKNLWNEDRLTARIISNLATKDKKGYIVGFSPYTSEALQRFAKGDFAGFVDGTLAYTPDSVQHALNVAWAMQEAVSKGTMPNYYGVFEYNGKKYSIGSPDKLPKGVVSLQEAAPQTYNALTAMFERASTPGHGSAKYVTGFKPEVQALFKSAGGPSLVTATTLTDVLNSTDAYRKAYIAKAQGGLAPWYDLWQPLQYYDAIINKSPKKVIPKFKQGRLVYLPGPDFSRTISNQLHVLQQLYNSPNVPDAVRLATQTEMNTYMTEMMVRKEMFKDIASGFSDMPALKVPTASVETAGKLSWAVGNPKASFDKPTIVYPKEATVDAMAERLAADPEHFGQALNAHSSVGQVTAANSADIAIKKFVEQQGDAVPSPEHLYSIGKLIDDAAAVVSKTKAGKSYHTERLQHLVDDLTKLREEKSPVYDQLKEVLTAADNASTDAVKGTDWVLDTIKSEIVNIPPDKITPEELAKLTENVKKANTILGEDVFVLTYGKVGTLENVPMVTLDTTKEHATKLFKKHEKALTAEGALHDITYSVGIPADEVYKKYPEAKKLLDEYLTCREEYYRLAGIPYSNEFITHVRSVDPEVATALDHQLYASFNAKRMADLSDMSNTLLQQVPEFREKTYGALGTTAYGRRFRGPASAWERIGITSKKKGKDGITYVKNHPVFKNDPIDVITGSFSMGTLHNSEFQSFVELFVNDNFKVKNYFKTPDELRNMFYDVAEDGRVGSNIDNLVLASPKYDATGKLIGFKKYANYTQAGLEAALKDENCVLLPVGAFSRLDAICKKDARMAHWWYRTVAKLTTPFKIGCLVNPGFLLGNASDAVLKQAVTMADQYGTSVTEELGNVARAYRDVQVLNNRFAETFDRYIKDMEARGEKLLDTDRSYQSLLYSGTARKRFSEYCNEVYNITGSENMADILLGEEAAKHIPALDLIDVQVMQLWQYLNGKLPTMKDNLQDLGDVAAQTRQVTGKYSDQNIIERILYGKYNYDPKKLSTWGLLSKNPLAEGVFAGSEYIEQSARASAILNDLRHRGMDLDALEQAMGILHDTDPVSASEAMHIRGMLEDALNAMNASNFDYDNVGPLLNAATYVMPFPTFYMKNIVFWMDLIEKNPQMVKNLLKTHNAMWDVSDEEESDNFVAEAKGRGALAFGNVDSERPLRKFFKGIYKPTPMQSMFGAFNAVQHPIESLTSRVNPLVTAPLGAVAGELGGADSDLTALLGGTDSVKYRPYNTKRFQKNMRAGDEDFSGLRYMFHRINPFDRAINTALRIPEKAKHGELAVSDIAPSVFQPRFK